MRCGTKAGIGSATVFCLAGLVSAGGSSLLADSPSASPPPVATPVFVPGLYDTESRNSAFRNEGVRKRECLASADVDAFRRETVARYLEAPQFRTVCKLSDTKRTADGFAFAMDCNSAKTIITFRFAKNLVTSVADTRVPARPEYSSSIVTLSRRIGACAKQPQGKAL